MKIIPNARACALVALLVSIGCQPQQQPEPAAAADPVTTVIYLMRHAETLLPPPEDAPRDPPLNIMGQERADALARLLSSEPITQIFSTELRRTQETAAPLAARLGIAVAPYDPSDLETFAGVLKAASGRVVVSGHSNTTPVLVGFLGGEPGEPIDESVEYDRLYTVIVRNGEVVTTLLQRYGDPLPDNWQELASTRC